MSQKKYKFHVNGMHCASCVVLTESEIKELPEVKNAKASLKHLSLEVEGEFKNASPEQVAHDLSAVLRPYGYSLSVEKNIENKKLHEFNIAVPIAIIFVLLFVLLQKVGLVNLINAKDLNYSTAFLIGVIASVSTCMAVVGGLVLSLSANFAKEGDKWKPQVLFHLGRIIAFFILGGIIGALGSAFTLNTFGTFALSVLIGIVMLVLGINLLDVFHFTKRLIPTMPKFIAKHTFSLSRFNHTFTPFLVGIATFFLPCGFTQSMQIYTLSSGSFVNGGLIMLSFALGTLPALSILSFSSYSIKDNKYKGVFSKTAGIVVILFALFNIVNSLVVIGLIPPVFNF